MTVLLWYDRHPYRRPGSVPLGSIFALACDRRHQVVAGLAFFGFAAWTLTRRHARRGRRGRCRAHGPLAVVTIGTAFFLAELGDKTMLATITLATTEEPIGTWLGSTAGMVAADAIAIAIGAFLGTRLPRERSRCSRPEHSWRSG